MLYYALKLLNSWRTILFNIFFHLKTNKIGARWAIYSKKMCNCMFTHLIAANSLHTGYWNENTMSDLQLIFLQLKRWKNLTLFHWLVWEMCLKIRIILSLTWFIVPGSLIDWEICYSDDAILRNVHAMYLSSITYLMFKQCGVLSLRISSSNLNEKNQKLKYGCKENTSKFKWQQPVYSQVSSARSCCRKLKQISAI